MVENSSVAGSKREFESPSAEISSSLAVDFCARGSWNCSKSRLGRYRYPGNKLFAECAWAGVRHTSSFNPVHRFLGVSTKSAHHEIELGHLPEARYVKQPSDTGERETRSAYCPNVGTCGLSGRGSSAVAIGLLSSALVECESKLDLGGMPSSREVALRLRRLYGCRTPGTHATPARTHPLHGVALSQRTLRCLQRIQEYSCWCWPVAARN